MDYVELARQKALKYGLDPDLFVRQIQAESAFRPDAVSSAGAIGLGQLMPATARELGVDPRDPSQNLEGAARYMRQQLDTFKDPALALAAYNAGPSRVKKAGGIPNITETKNYVAKIMGAGGSTMTPAAGTDVVDQMKSAPGGIRGILDFASERNPETGMSRFEQFAAALDPLILPEMRAGQAIRATGAQRVKTAKTNKTIEWLKKNGYAEIAAALEINPEGASNVMSAILSQKTKPSASGDTSMVLTGAEVMKLVPGVKLNPDAPYTVKRKGGQIVDIDAVGGLQPDLTPFQEEAQKGEVKDLREIRNVGQQAQRNQAQVQLLGNLLEQTDTGIAAGLASRANALGLGDFRGDTAAAAEAIISQLVPQQRPPGAGTISDADLALYKASLPSIAASPGGNKLIIQSMLALLEHDIKVGQIAQQALDQTISPAEAYSQMANLPNPFASVRPFFGAKPAPQTTTREDALKILQQEGVLD